MAKGRKTSKPKQKSYQRITRENDPMGVYAVLDEALGRYRRELKDEDCRIALAWRFGWKRNKDGQLVLGKCQKVNELSKEYADFDFIIVFNHEAWKELDGEQRLALMHHELCHAAISTDPSGNARKDARGRTMFRVKHHDVEEFGDVIAVHGIYKQDLNEFCLAAIRSARPPQPALPGMGPEEAKGGDGAKTDPATEAPAVAGKIEPSGNGHGKEHAGEAKTMPAAARARRPVPASRKRTTGSRSRK